MKNVFFIILIILFPSFVFSQKSLTWEVLEYNKNSFYNTNYGNIISANKNRYIIRAKSGGVNDSLLLSSDFGETWICIYSFEESIKIKSIEILDDNSIFLALNNVNTYQKATRGMIKYTTDFGKTWGTLNLKEKEQLNWLDMYDRNYGIAFTTTKLVDSVKYSLYYTASSWQSMKEIKYPSNYFCSGLWLLDSNVISIYSYYTGKENYFYKSTDSGNSWIKSNDSVPLGLRNIHADNSGILWAAGGIPNGKGWQRSDLIAKSENGGLTWQIVINQEIQPVAYGLDFINMADNGFGIASGGGNKLYFSSNHGKNWYLQDLPGEVWLGPSSPQIAQMSGSYIFLQNPFYLLRSDLSFTLKAPKFLSPLYDTSEINDRFDIIWNSIDGAYEYELQSSKFLNFSEIIHWFKNLKDTVKTVEMNYNTKYYFRVRAYNNVDTSYWSDIRYIVTKDNKDKLSSPVFLYPINFSDSVERNPTIIWNKVENAKYYHFQMAERDIIPGVELAYDINFIKDTSIKINDLKANQYYFAKIRAFNDNDSSKWNTQIGSGLRFTTGDYFLDVKFHELTASLNITPLPSISQLQVKLFNSKFSRSSIFQIYNTTGVKLKEFNLPLTEGENQIPIDVSDLSNGVYYLVIDTGDKILSKKFIVSR